MSTLIDTMDLNLKILESESKDGRMVIEGVFQMADTPNKNKRTYPGKLWERLLAKDSPIMEKVRSSAMIGHLEHPSDGATTLQQLCHLVKDLRLEGKQVIGRAVIADTPAGRIAREAVSMGIRLGVSSRGQGTVGPNGVVCEDYQLETFDLVYNPSTPNAYPRPVIESDSRGEQTKEQQMSVPISSDTFRALEAKAQQFLSESSKSLQKLPRQTLNQMAESLLLLSEQLGPLMETSEYGSVAIELQERIVAQRTNVIRALNGVTTGSRRTRITEEDATDDPEDKAEGDPADDEEDDAEAAKEKENGKGPMPERVENLKKLLKEAKGQLIENNKKQDASNKLIEALTKKGAEFKKERDSLQERYKAALRVLAIYRDMTERERVAEAVAAVIGKDPLLERAKDMLGKSVSVAEVFATALQLQKGETPTTNTRTGLPERNSSLNSETDQTGVSRPASAARQQDRKLNLTEAVVGATRSPRAVTSKAAK